MEGSVKFEIFGFGKRLKSMLKVDFRRMLKSRLFYILIACALLVPIVMTVMLTMMDGQESVNQQTGEVTIMEGPDSTWQSIGTLPSDEPAATDASAVGGMGAMGGMDVMSMCNINMAFMGVAVFVCLFISEDFRSGYAKNLFTVRARKGEYVISKTLVGFVCGALMLIAYFIGAMLGGAISSLSFELVGGLTVGNIVMCMIAKIFLMFVFVSIFTLISVAAKQKAWLSICGSLGGGMLLFMMVSMITPLNSTLINVALCLVGGLLFALGLGAISRVVLKKTSLV
ncbi:MAG: ABC transporter permease subunit [Clostridia bacterium]|nr:ABC transporter permease subunit [Clostridia bacterium]